MSPRLKIGVTPWRVDPSGSSETHAAQAEHAERLGFHSYWLPESHFADEASIPAPLLLLAAAAARTSKLRLGTTSYLLPIRHAIHVAEEVAVLDRLSGGRVILGVGRGFRASLFSVFDVPVAQKRQRFQSTLEAMLSAWRGEPVTLDEDGTGDDAAPVLVSPLPVQQPHPPIWVAAFGPKAVAQAGGLAMPYLASPIESLPSLADNYARHREAIPEERRAESLAVPVMRTVFITRDAVIAERVRKELAGQSAALARSGAAALRRAADADIDSVALVGEPERVADGIRQYRETIGMTHMIARGRVPGAETRDVEASLELLAELGSDGL